MIIDSHQHFWDKRIFNYPWLTPELGCLYRAFLPKDLEELLAPAGVEKTVVVQAMPSLDEARWLLQLADENSFIGGVVGWVDLLDKHIESVLDEFAKNPKFKSVRHQIEDESNREWLLQNQVLTSLKQVSEFGLCFDALLKHEQLWQLERLMDACPDLHIVIDHAAKPDIKGKEFDSWAKHLEQAARLPIYCKFSGLFTEADHMNWTQEDLAPYYRHIMDSFGADRVMFGSDWPVSTMASDYNRTVKTSLSLCKDLTAHENEKIFCQNAKDFYNIV